MFSPVSRKFLAMPNIALYIVSLFIPRTKFFHLYRCGVFNSCILFICSVYILVVWITLPHSEHVFFSNISTLNWLTTNITLYRVFLKFSYTWNELFVVNWLISKFFWGSTKWNKVSYPHYLKILMKLSKHDISYSLKRDRKSISKITFYANLRVSPIDTELWYFFKSFLFKSAIPWSEWDQLDGFVEHFFF